MRNYKALTVMKMNHYFLLYHQSSLFLLAHLKQRLLRLLPLLQQQWRHHRLRGDYLLAGSSLSHSEGTYTSTDHR
jgi:hypothetical protein